METPQWSINFI